MCQNMVEMLKSPVAANITLRGSHGLWENKMFVQCLHCTLNFSSSTRKSTIKHIYVNSVNKVSMGEEVGSLYGIQPHRNQGVKWAFEITRRKGNIVMFSSLEYRVVCEENEHNLQIRKIEEEIDEFSYEQKLPPWGNFEVSEDHGIESGGSSLPIQSDTAKVICTFEPKLHFLEERDEEILSKRILGLSRSNKVRSALGLFMSMEVSGLRPNHHAVNSLISCLLRNGLLYDALKVFEIIKKNKITTGHTYSLILKAVASAEGCDSALKMFMELDGEGMHQNDFDIIAYNTMISICARSNKWVDAEMFWKSLKNNGHRATTVTFDLLVSTFVRCDQPELAFQAYSEMLQEGLQPSGDMMQAIISVCTKERKWDLALKVFHNMLNIGLEPNLIAYNALINALGKVGEVEQAFKIFNLMKYSDHTPDVYTWSALTGALYNGNRYSDAIRLFESIKRERSCQLNAHLYNTALMSCQRLSLWDRALQLLWQMEASELSVSAESYNLVISACETARKPKVALEVYEHMVHSKCSPNTFTYLSLIRACIWGSLWFEVEEILDHITPDVSLYNAAIHGMCLRGKITSAKKLYMKMRENGLEPDGKTRALMLQNLKKDSDRKSNRYYSSRRR
ncbi:hypothetical protein GIB67_007247 [Kingdonia uniflora]|uniref:Pentatricopeptide repeat-containing protein n=1 Tax=Kingdonia uniflora TaxID=39325 RepID=A0A7J7NX04_9MAGN|nr:hypothetical protein GIB67_007247 [Kingdonia uniflora]